MYQQTESVWKRVQGQGLMLRNLQLTASIQSSGDDVQFTQVQAHVITSCGWLFFYICLQWKGFELILEMSILFCHLHKIGAQFPCRQHLRALIYSQSTSILHNKPLLCEGSSVSHTIIQIYTAVGIIKIIKMRGRHCAQCLVNYHRFYHQKSLWELSNSNRPSLSGSATGMANFTFDVHLGMIVIYMKIW